jgi:uncharacterized protein YbjT (DUF2867 family)
MDVVVIGGHGKIALHLERMLSGRGDRVRGVIRKPEQAADLEAAGAEAVICDIENEDLAEAVKGADAVVFAAGAGPGSGPERKSTVDYGAAVKLIEACEANGISRYLMVSAFGTERPDTWSDEMIPYYEAKRDADEELEHAGLKHTIVRPGRLTDDAGTGKVSAGNLDDAGSVTREDVAAVLAEALLADNTVGKAFDLLEGDTPIPEAVRAV